MPHVLRWDKNQAGKRMRGYGTAAYRIAPDKTNRRQ